MAARIQSVTGGYGHFFGAAYKVNNLKAPPVLQLIRHDSARTAVTCGQWRRALSVNSVRSAAAADASQRGRQQTIICNCRAPSGACLPSRCATPRQGSLLPAAFFHSDSSARPRAQRIDFRSQSVGFGSPRPQDARRAVVEPRPRLPLRIPLLLPITSLCTRTCRSPK
jgi:hypothetical protein